MSWQGSRLLRYLLYSLLILVLYILQGTPGLFPEILGARPILLLSVALSIAMFEPAIPTIAFAVAAGILLDLGYGDTLGMHAIMFVLICYLVSALTKSILQVNLVTATIIAVISTAIVIFFGWLFQYVLAGYSYAGYALTNVYIPKFFYTLIMFPLIFLGTNLIASFIRSAEEP